MPNATQQRIVENTAGSSALKVDRDRGVIEGVKCLGRESKNGRVYSDKSMADALRLYEGADVNVDHPSKPNASRGMAEGFGILRSTRLKPDGVYADLHYIKAHPLADMIAERAERFPGHFGMSHVALGSVRENPAGGLVVEGLDSVESVDIVRSPATNAGLFESEGGPPVTTKKTKAGEHPTVRSILEANRKVPLAAGLLVLFEEEPEMLGPIADAPVADAPAADASSDDQILAAFRSMIIAAVDDKALDMKATLDRIKKILKTQEDLLTEKPKKEPAGDGPPKDEEVSEQIKRENVELRSRLSISEALDTRGVSRSNLSEAQNRVLDRCSTKEEALDLLESLGTAANKPNVRPKHPANGETETGSGYRTLKEERDRRRKRSGKTPV